MVNPLTLLLPLLSLLPSPALSILARDPGVVDFHIPLIGPPITSQSPNSPSPKFHYAARPTVQVERPPAIIFTATEKNVLAALRPNKGDIVWRQEFQESDPILKFYLHQDGILVLSGPGSSNIRIFSALTGHLIWELSQHPTTLGLLPEPGLDGSSAFFLQTVTGKASQSVAPDVMSLANGRTVRRLKGTTGEVKWKWEIDPSEHPGTILHTLSPPVPTRPAGPPQTNPIGVLSLTPTSHGYTLNLILLDPETGLATTSSQELSPIKSSLIKRPTDVLVAGGGIDHSYSSIVDPTNAPKFPPPALVYLDSKSKQVHYVCIPSGGNQVQNPKVFNQQGAKIVEILDVGLSENGYFVAKRDDGSALVLAVEADDGRNAGGCAVKVAWDFSDQNTKALFTGTVDRNGGVHVMRMSYSDVLQMVSISTYSVDLAEFSDRGVVSGQTFAYNPYKHGGILHAAVEVSPRPNNVPITRSLVTTSSGSLQMWAGQEVSWLREEGLTGLEGGDKVVFVELPDKIVKEIEDEVGMGVASDSLRKGREGFGERLERHFEEVLRISPTIVVQSTITTLSSSLTSILQSLSILPPSTKPSTTSLRSITALSSDGSLIRDTFGFKKLAIAASDRGKIFALDMSSGKRIGEVLPFGTEGVRWKALAVLSHAKPGVDPVVGAVAEVPDEKNVLHLRAIAFNALSGKILTPVGANDLAESVTVKEVFQLPAGPGGHVQPLVIVDSNDKMHVFPKEESRDLPTDVHFFQKNSSQRLVGNRLQADGLNQVSWNVVLDEDEEIVEVAKQTSDIVASSGRVLGNRQTLYKYLNPHLVAIATMKPSTSTGSVYLLDVVTGEIVYSTEHFGEVETRKGGIKVVLTENWLVYSFVEKASQGKRERIISVELFEGDGRDVEGRTRPTALSKSFLFLAGIRTLGFTRTRLGITTKSLLIGTDRNQIHSVSRRFLDPRRPLGKPSKDDQEEMLIPYDPLIPPNPLWVVSHSNPVLGLRGFASTSAILESTSLVLAYGLDLFATRINPSGTFDILSESFNKVQLVLTMLALLVGIMVAAPAVKNKTLKAKWYS